MWGRLSAAGMDRKGIEKQARLFQYEIWHNRHALFPMGVPSPSAMFRPDVAACALDGRPLRQRFVDDKDSAAFGRLFCFGRIRPVRTDVHAPRNSSPSKRPERRHSSR